MTVETEGMPEREAAAMGTLPPDDPPGARHGSSLSSTTTCSPASVDMGTRQDPCGGPPHRAMGTLHMSVQRGKRNRRCRGGPAARRCRPSARAVRI